jgi:hypothetical protein
MLGHDVGFGYCRAPGRPLPCGKVFDCWFETFDVQAFIRKHFSEHEVQEILAPRQEKLTSLVELIEKARKANESKP